MQTLIHPNIVHYLNVNKCLSNYCKSFETRNDIFLVMEYVEFGSLEDLIDQLKPT